HALTLHFLFQNAESLIDIVVAHKNLQIDVPFSRGAATHTRKRHFKKKVPRADQTATGLPTTGSASTSVVRAPWPFARPLRRRANSRQQACPCGGLRRYRSRRAVPR